MYKVLTLIPKRVRNTKNQISGSGVLFQYSRYWFCLEFVLLGFFFSSKLSGATDGEGKPMDLRKHIFLVQL